MTELTFEQKERVAFNKWALRVRLLPEHREVAWRAWQARASTVVS